MRPPGLLEYQTPLAEPGSLTARSQVASLLSDGFTCLVSGTDPLDSAWSIRRRPTVTTLLIDKAGLPPIDWRRSSPLGGNDEEVLISQSPDFVGHQHPVGEMGGNCGEAQPNTHQCTDDRPEGIDITSQVDRGGDSGEQG